MNQNSSLSPTASDTKVAIATRSMFEDLYSLSDALLPQVATRMSETYRFQRHRLVRSTSTEYFREVLDLNADWVVNIDEDAFLLDINSLCDLINVMRDGGFCICGMPDGGVVPIRSHNPIACNAFFNVLDLRRVRRVWSDWSSTVNERYDPEYEALTPPFAKQSLIQYDDFEPYYCLYFSLIKAGLSILYLDGETWADGISTVLKMPSGKPFLIHSWFARHWKRSASTRDRIMGLIEFARLSQRINGSAS